MCKLCPEKIAHNVERLHTKLRSYGATSSQLADAKRLVAACARLIAAQDAFDLEILSGGDVASARRLLRIEKQRAESYLHPQEAGE